MCPFAIVICEVGGVATQCIQSPGDADARWHPYQCGRAVCGRRGSAFEAIPNNKGLRDLILSFSLIPPPLLSLSHGIRQRGANTFSGLSLPLVHWPSPFTPSPFPNSMKEHSPPPNPQNKKGPLQSLTQQSPSDLS